MGQHMKTFPDGSFLEFGTGRFDEWCVYLTKRDGTCKAPRDAECFKALRELAGRHSRERVYRDFVRVYDMTGKEADASAFDGISQIAASYGSDALWADVLFSTLYMAMIAEEKKEHAVLGKRIKRLGVYVLLKEGWGVSEAANFTRGMGCREIAALCRKRGF